MAECDVDDDVDEIDTTWLPPIGKGRAGVQLLMLDNERRLVTQLGGAPRGSVRTADAVGDGDGRYQLALEIGGDGASIRVGVVTTRWDSWGGLLIDEQNAECRACWSASTLMGGLGEAYSGRNAPRYGDGDTLQLTLDMGAGTLHMRNRTTGEAATVVQGLSRSAGPYAIAVSLYSGRLQNSVRILPPALCEAAVPVAEAPGGAGGAGGAGGGGGAGSGAGGAPAAVAAVAAAAAAPVLACAAAAPLAPPAAAAGGSGGAGGGGGDSSSSSSSDDDDEAAAATTAS